MNRFVRLWGQLCLLLALAACGGGGGGGGGDAPATALTFNPSTVTANFQTGTSATVTVHATARNPSIFTGSVYVFIEDPQRVLADDFNLSSVNESTFAATLYTSSSLPPGRHQGRLSVSLCRDAGCVSQYPGSPSTLPYDFTVSHAPLVATPVQPATATAYLGGTLQHSVAVNVSSSNAWTVSTTASWLQPSTASGTGNGTFSVSYNALGMAVGNHAANVTVQSTDGQRVDVPFTLDVLPNQFVLTTGVPTFSMINGTTAAAQDLGFALGSGTSAPWSATTTAPWLIATPLSGATPSTVSLRPDPNQGPLASGSHSAALVLSSTGVADRSVTTQLSLIRPTLSTAGMSVTLGGPRGRDLSSRQMMISLNTGANAWPWQLSTLPAWLQSTTPSGQVSQSGSFLQFMPNPGAITAGSMATTVTATATVNGDTVSAPITVNLNADQRRLLPSAWGVGLAATPVGAVLTRTLTIRDNFGSLMSWSATSNRPWLTVTASGDTANATALQLTADPASLADGALHEATVTVSSGLASVEAAVIRVALWKDSNGQASARTLAVNYPTITADPVRPYIYAHSGGSSVTVFNAYTGQQVTTYANVVAALGRMAVSPDGSRLFALDTAGRNLGVVDLATGTSQTPWTLDNAVDTLTPLLVARPNGVEVVLLGDGQAYRNGVSLGNTQIYGTSMSATADGNRVITQNSGISPSSVALYDLDYSAVAGGSLSVVVRVGGRSVNGSSNGKDVAFSPDGSNALVASGAPYRCSRADPSTLSFVGSLPGGDHYPNNVEVTSDGRLICGAFSWYGQHDFWVHSSAGALLGGYRVAGYARVIRDRQLVVTPDGLIVVASTDDPRLVFVPIGPAP
jgi:hypothetical protein